MRGRGGKGGEGNGKGMGGEGKEGNEEGMGGEGKCREGNGLDRVWEEEIKCMDEK